MSSSWEPQLSQMPEAIAADPTCGSGAARSGPCRRCGPASRSVWCIRPPAASGRWTVVKESVMTTLTAPTLMARKGSGRPLVMVTAYDAPGARMADAAGVDLILVGDSLAMVVLGYDDTLQVTIGDMAHHVGAVARAKPRAFVVGD